MTEVSQEERDGDDRVGVSEPAAGASGAEPLAPEPDATQEETAPVSGAASTTAAVDTEVAAVLEQVHGLEERSVEEHVAVLEDAHRRLRRALDSSRNEA